MGDELVWEVQPIFQGLNQQGSLYWVERAVIEYAANTVESLAVEYVDGLGNTIAVGTLDSSTSRTYDEFSIEAPAPIREFRIDIGNLDEDVEVYGVEVYVRPVICTVQDRTRPGELVKIDGKMIDQTQSIIFDMDPYTNLTDGELFIPLIESLSIDADTSAVTLAPKIVTELGTIFLDEFSSNSRATQTYDINQVGNILYVQIDGDFTTGVALYDIQLQMRSLDLGINIVEDAG